MIHFSFIDVLRIYAVGIVVLDHFLGGVTGGHLGVDIFFVISGFVFAHTFLNSEITAVGIKHYYFKRVDRLAPAMILVAIITLFFAFVLLPADDIRNVIESVIASLALNANNYFYLTQGYFAADASYVPLLHYWSLGVEEQFYIILPLLCLLSLKYSISFNTLFIILGVLSISFYILFPYPESFYLLPARVFQFIVGMLVYRMRSKIKVNNFVYYILLVILFIFPFLDLENEKVKVILCTSLAGLVMLLMPASTSESNNLRRYLSYLGMLTYPIYLVHQPLLVYSKVYFGYVVTSNNLIYYLLFCFILAVTIESLTKGFRKRESNELFSYKRVAFIGTWISLGIITCLMYLLGINDNVRLSSSKQQVIDAHFTPNYGISKICSSVHSDDLACISESSELVFWGDSYAMHVASSSPSTGIELGQATMSSCAPIFGLAKVNQSNTVDRANRCLKFNSNVKEFFASTKSVKKIVLSSVFDFDDGTKFLLAGGDVVDYKIDILITAFNETMNVLLERDVEVIVVMPTPTNSTNIGMCLKRVMINGLSFDECQFRRNTYNEFETYLLKEWSEYLLIPSDIICNQDYCSAAIDDVPLYIDDGHITKLGSKLVFKNLYQETCNARNTKC